jgi:hypothetical protein
MVIDRDCYRLEPTVLYRKFSCKEVRTAECLLLNILDIFRIGRNRALTLNSRMLVVVATRLAAVKKAPRRKRSSHAHFEAGWSVSRAWVSPPCSESIGSRQHAYVAAIFSK